MTCKNKDAEILFISDLHLDASQTDITENFQHFIETRANQARVLYILGDLFDVWIGDDDINPERHPFLQLIAGLAQRISVKVMRGNRDFLMGQALAQRLGIELIPDPFLIQLGAQRIALMHGDQLCTDDVEYQKFRTLVRSPEWQDQFLSKPLQERREIAAGLRKNSRDAMQNKSEVIMDVSAGAVDQCFEQHGVDTIIHGHTHRPAVHSLTEGKTRIVLGDWQPEASFLSWKNGDFSLTDKRLG